MSVLWADTRGVRLLDRGDEVARLDVALAAAQAGVGCSVLIEGPAGIGKTALLGETRSRAAAAGMAVLAGRGTELEVDYALGVVRQCLLPTVRGYDEAGRARLFEGAAARAAPAVLDVVDDESAATPFAMAHALYWLVANIAAERPLLFVVDDAQWADDASLRFLAFLVRRAESLPAVVVSACRLDADRPSAAPIAQLRADPATDVIVPRPLSKEAVTTLLASGGATVAPEFARACRDATGGNPFLLRHLVAALRGEGIEFSAAAAGRVSRVTPPEIAQSVRQTLSRLDGASVALARAVAVLGDGAGLVEASSLADLEPAAAAEAAARLVACGLLVDERPLAFVHPLLRSAVTATMPSADRDGLHRRAAATLAAAGAPVEHQAVHLRAAEPAGCDHVVETLRRAARRARDRGAPAAAAELLERALAEPPREADRTDVLLELGHAHLVAGSAARASEVSRRAYELTDDPVRRARALRLKALAAPTDLADMLERGPLLTRVMAELPAAERELLLELKADAVLVYSVGDRQRYTELAAEAERMHGDTPGEALVLGVYILRRVLDDVSGEEVAALARRAARQVDALIADAVGGRPFTGVALGLHWADALDEEEPLVVRSTQNAQRQGSAPGFANGSTLLAQINRRRGRLREAEADARSGVAAGEAWSVAMACGALAATLLDQGRVGAAWEALELGGLCGEIGAAPPLTELLMTRMRVRAARGEHHAALVDWRAAVDRPVQGVPRASWIENYVAAAESLRAIGDRDGAHALATEAVDVARRWNTPAPIGEALRGLARVSDDAVAHDLLRESVQRLERSPARLAHARALVDLGALLRRRGDRRDSREPLREGLDLASAANADGLSEHARQELAASGIRVPRRTPLTRDRLTPSERRIADLAAAGASNAEIAQSLFVTVKTVEGHLTSTYRKLDIGKRSQLTAALKSE